jgi:hypothetical protein
VHIETFYFCIFHLSLFRSVSRPTRSSPFSVNRLISHFGSATGHEPVRPDWNIPAHKAAYRPAPIEFLDRPSRKLGVKINIEALSGLGVGGNKIRRLEFYFGAAFAHGGDTVLLTAGAVQSNYVRAVSTAAAKLGLEQLDCPQPSVSHEKDS